VTPTEPDIQQLDPDQVREGAALWLSRLQLGTADEDAFARWRDEHPTHALEFARAVANWEALRNAVTEDDRQGPAQGFTRRHLLKIAAGSAAAAAVGGVLWISRFYSWTRIETEIGEFRKISLPDSSVVELNTDTEMSWRLAGNRPAIRLARGEIAVTLRPGISALLSSEGFIATLLAGQYNARYVSDLLRLTVVQGAALIEGATATAGQRVTATAAGTVKIDPEDNMDGATAWQNGEIVFHEEPLIAAVAEYNRYLTRKIVLVAPKAEFQRVGGRFTTTNPQAFLRAVSLALDLQTTQTDRGYLLAPKI
jgi:transmembrane sensor